MTRAIELGVPESAPFEGRHDAFASCACTTDHHPPVLTFQWHHVRPIAMGGENTKYGVLDRNGIWLCSTTHDNVHEILRLLCLQGSLTYYEVQTSLPHRTVSRYAHKVALEGWRRWTNNEWGAPS